MLEGSSWEYLDWGPAWESNGATGGLWGPLRCPVGPSKVVPVVWCGAETEQKSALQASLRACGAHKENLKNYIKIAQQAQAGT